MYKRLSTVQHGFITMIILIVLIVGGIISFAWWRVANAKQKTVLIDNVCSQSGKVVDDLKTCSTK